MSMWLFNVSVDGYMREIKADEEYGHAKLRMSGADWSVVACLFADDTLLYKESARELERAKDTFYSLPEKKTE